MKYTGLQGIDHLWYGKLHSDWRIIQADYIFHQPIQQTSDRWTTQVIELMTQLSYQVWITRNNYLHMTDNNRLN